MPVQLTTRTVRVGNAAGYVLFEERLGTLLTVIDRNTGGVLSLVRPGVAAVDERNVPAGNPRSPLRRGMAPGPGPGTGHPACASRLAVVGYY